MAHETAYGFSLDFVLPFSSSFQPVQFHPLGTFPRRLVQCHPHVTYPQVIHVFVLLMTAYIGARLLGLRDDGSGDPGDPPGGDPPTFDKAWIFPILCKSFLMLSFPLHLSFIQVDSKVGGLEALLVLYICAAILTACVRKSGTRTCVRCQQSIYPWQSPYKDSYQGQEHDRASEYDECEESRRRGWMTCGEPGDAEREPFRRPPAR